MTDSNIPTDSRHGYSLLWELQQTSNIRPSYLFGTMHLRDLRVFRNITAIEDIILNSDTYVAEVDLNALSSSQNITIQQNHDLLKPQKILSSKKTEKARKILKKSLGVDISLYETWHPLFVLDRIVEAATQDLAATSLDQHLWQFAQRNQMEIRGVETVAEQIEILHKMDPSDQNKALMDIVRNIKRFRRNLNKLVNYYTDQDLRMIYKVTKKSLGRNRKIHIHFRNRRMAERITAMTGEKSHFIAIGAAHLYGKNGVLRFLKQHGIKIKPIDY